MHRRRIVAAVRIVVIHAHPARDSFSAALCTTALDALEHAGHEVRLHDLYREGFVTEMSLAEHRAYHRVQPIVSDEVLRHSADVSWAEALVFVYPTWWAGLPAVLKGWLERVMVPGVAFTFDEKSGKVRSNLRNIRLLVGITTYGSSRPYVAAMGDGGRSTITRALRMLCRRRTRSIWLGLYGVDTSTPAERNGFLHRVEARLARL